MLKQLTAVFLLLAFIFQTFNKAFIIVDYYANTTSFTLNCENKAKPTMHCNGKCQMLNKLKQEDKKDERNPERKTESKHEVTLFSKSFFSTISSLEYTIVPAKFTHLNSGKEINLPRTIFRPPIN